MDTGVLLLDAVVVHFLLNSKTFVHCITHTSQFGLCRLVTTLEDHLLCVQLDYVHHKQVTHMENLSRTLPDVSQSVWCHHIWDDNRHLPNCTNVISFSWMLSIY